jgi:hypothetical protein
MKRVSTFLAAWLCAATAIFANLPTVEQRTNEAEEAPSEISYTIDKANGNLYRGTAANQKWNSTWKSNATPQLQFGCGPNNMNWDGNNVQLMTGTAGSATYTLMAPTGYVLS